MRRFFSMVIVFAACGFARAYQFNLPPGTGVINVRDFGARGDGVTDDSDAIFRAIARVYQDDNKTYNRYRNIGVIWFPAGTYKVSRSIEGRVPGQENGWSGGWRSGFHLLGENRDTTIIRLADNCAGFRDKTKPRAVVATGSENDDYKPGTGGGNRAFRHAVINLTIDVGAGNPGAIGLDFVASNRGTVEDVRLRAPEGSGFCGLSLERHWPGPALVKRLEVEGFDYGIRVEHYQYGMTFEHVTLRGQNVLGIRNTNNVLAFRKLSVEGRVPAVESRGGHGLVVLLDAELKAGAGLSPGTAAITGDSMFYLRDTVVSGYAAVLRNNAGKDLLAATRGVAFYASPAFNAGAATDAPMRLPVKETPEFHSTKPNDWANCVDFGAVAGGPDASDAIQRAVDSGKAIVYLPNGNYHIGKPIVLRGNIRKIIGFCGAMTAPKGMPAFRVERLAGPSVTLEHIAFPENGLLQAGNSAVALRHVDFGWVESEAGATGDIFLEDTIGKPITVAAGQSLWGRQVNCEFGADPLVVNHGNQYAGSSGGSILIAAGRWDAASAGSLSAQGGTDSWSGCGGGGRIAVKARQGKIPAGVDMVAYGGSYSEANNNRLGSAGTIYTETPDGRQIIVRNYNDMTERKTVIPARLKSADNANICAADDPVDFKQVGLVIERGAVVFEDALTLREIQIQTSAGRMDLNGRRIKVDDVYIAGERIRHGVHTAASLAQIMDSDPQQAGELVVGRQATLLLVR